MVADDRDGAVAALERRLVGFQVSTQPADLGFLLAPLLSLVEHPHVPVALPPLDAPGTPFQKAVWRALQAIPPGRTVSYAELAARAGRPRAVRAAASACAVNRHAIAIPCHRAVRADGSIGGYRWGEGRKRRLLEWEARVAGGA